MISINLLQYFQPFYSNFGISDTSGILNIHGIPRILCGIIKIIFILKNKEDQNFF